MMKRDHGFLTEAFPRVLWSRVAPAEPPLNTLLGAARGATGVGATRAGGTLVGATGVDTVRGGGVVTMGRGCGCGWTVTGGRTGAGGWTGTGLTMAGEAGVGVTRCTARCTSVRLVVGSKAFFAGGGTGCLPIGSGAGSWRTAPEMGLTVGTAAGLAVGFTAVVPRGRLRPS